MSSIIQDGTGKGFLAKVDSTNRLLTRTVEGSEQDAASANGDAYNINTGTINLTSGSASSLLYFRNDQLVDFDVSSIFYILGNSTGGSGDLLVEVLRNPTAGTLVSGGTDFDAINRNFGSGQVLSATIKKGVEGSTLTDGEVIISTILTSPGRVPVTGASIVMPNSTTLGIRVTPQSGNTSMDVQLALAGYLRG